MEEFGSIMLWPEDDDVLLQELLDNVSPFNPLVPQQPISSSGTTQESISASSSTSNESVMMLPNFYSSTSQCQDVSRIEGFQAMDTKQSLGDKGRDYKYTLKIKSCDAATDDGYKWRKYGQKTIKNSPNPRSYYRCTNPRCGAKKQVELSSQEPGTFIITYEGLHLHYAFPLYPIMDENNTLFDQPLAKKLKKSYSNTLETTEETRKEKSQPKTEYTKQYPTTDIFEQSFEEHQQMSSWGLLEDIVPLKIRQPTSTTTDSNSNSCSSSYPSTPSSPSTLSEFFESQFYVPF